MNLARNFATEGTGRHSGYRYITPEFDRISSVVTASEPDPFLHFTRWISEAIKQGVVEPNAMVLATASAAGMPSTRIVLLHSFSESGFVFFTDRGSRKFTEIAVNPKASILFYWKETQQQIRIEGELVQLSAGSVANRLLDAVESVSKRGVALNANLCLTEMFNERARQWASDKNVNSPRWCAFELAPERFEFWEGRANGESDRKFYSRTPAGWNTTEKTV